MNHVAYKKPVVGLYSMGLRAYWSQFPGLRERLIHYGEFIEARLAELGADVCNFGLVDDAESGMAAGDYFAREQVDLVFGHAATYITSDAVLPVHQICKAKVIILNLQPTARINYAETTTGEWLAHCGACPVPEIVNALERAAIDTTVINGLLGLSVTPTISLTDENTAHRPEAKRAWSQIAEWLSAAKVMRNLRGARFGFLGNTYSGMLDLYSDFTMLQAQTGIHIDVLEMCDLNAELEQLDPNALVQKRQEIEEFFTISETAAADPIAQKPSEVQLDWSARVAVALDALVEKRNLDALSYYYHGSPNSPYEKLQAGFIVGHSLLTARGIPCAGEGDLKTCVAMKICDILGAGGSFCEIVVTDYEDGTLLLGHDGPFHLEIAKEKPILRGMGLYHGKQGSGVSVEAKVKQGPITTWGCTQVRSGKLKFIVSDALSTDGSIMTIGNTQTAVKFKQEPDAYMDEWFAQAPTHHFAMAVGHLSGIAKKLGTLMHVETVQIEQ